MDFREEQQIICERYGSPYYESLTSSKVGISKNIKDGIWPINGLRHPLNGDTTGWYIWAGEEFSTEDDFFLPMHIKHLEEYCPLILKYLGLAPGWRFLVTNDYEDVWQDPSLLDVD